MGKDDAEMVALKKELEDLINKCKVVLKKKKKKKKRSTVIE